MHIRRLSASIALAVTASLALSVSPYSATAEQVVPAPQAPAAPPVPVKAPASAPADTPRLLTPILAKAAPTGAQLALAKARRAVSAAVSRVRHGQYVRGRSGPNQFDCSGLMVYAYRQVNMSLAHSSRALSTRGRKISKSNLRPGDLVFFYTPIHHVGMYIGNGKFVHARNPRDDLEITRLSQYPHYRWARRILSF